MGSYTNIKNGENMRREAIIGGLLLLTLLLTISGILLYLKLQIRNYAIIKVVGINVYWDSNCTSPAEEIDWGVIYAWKNYSKQVFFKNLGNTNLTLSLEVTDWDPPYASDYFIASWTYNGEVIKPLECLPVNFTLVCVYDPNTMELLNFTDFSFVYKVTTEEVS